MTGAPKHLYLTGYRGSGKTSVARHLAMCLGVDPIDLDDLIETAAGMTIREIFQREGEAGFRQREQAALQRLQHLPATVVALGGGAILSEENRQLIRRTGHCVWLDADLQTLVQRIAEDHTTAQRRPSLTQLDPTAEIAQLLQQRLPLYQQMADCRIDTANRSVEEIADAILDWLEEP